MPEELEIIEEHTDEDCQELSKKIVSFNERNIPNLNFQRICLLIKNAEGEIKAGLIAVAYWDCVFLDILWVSDELRHLGYGSKLMKRFEEIVKNHNFNLIHLDTFDFQAQKFYKKLGYQVFGVLEDCPKGHKRYYMKKTIYK
ncbi:MAG: GNAT family N-acetyltransferase [Candidatus Sericytochromatia bacterium]